MANLLRKECQGCSEARRPSLTYSMFRKTLRNRCIRLLIKSQLLNLFDSQSFQLKTYCKLNILVFLAGGGLPHLSIGGLSPPIPSRHVARTRKRRGSGRSEGRRMGSMDGRRCAGRAVELRLPESTSGRAGFGGFPGASVTPSPHPQSKHCRPFVRSRRSCLLDILR